MDHNTYGGGVGGGNNNHSTSMMMMGFGSSETNNSNNHNVMMMMPLSSNPNPNNFNNITTTITSNMNNGGNNNIFLPVAITNNNSSNNHFNNSSSSSSLKSKIMSHPHYPRLLSAYINCQKIGAPDEVIVRLEQACASEMAAVAHERQGQDHQEQGNMMMMMNSNIKIGDDPALDQFMEAYCEMLVKYEQELSKPFKEAMLFLNTMESQFKSHSLFSTPSTLNYSVNGETAMDTNGGSSDEEIHVSANFVDPQAEDKELKGQLLRKYSGYLGSLKHEFMKKRKKGKLPKEARQQLLDWWSQHYKWPYPSESQKVALAESTGLDQKQINNWFINQRKRHWKPSEDMQFVMMDASAHAHSHPNHYYMDTILPSNPFPMDIPPAGFL